MNASKLWWNGPGMLSIIVYMRLYTADDVARILCGLAFAVRFIVYWHNKWIYVVVLGQLISSEWGSLCHVSNVVEHYSHTLARIHNVYKWANIILLFSWHTHDATRVKDAILCQEGGSGKSFSQKKPYIHNNYGVRAVTAQLKQWDFGGIIF